MNPEEVTTVIMQFKFPSVPLAVPSSPRTGGNENVWHCHILEHEEHDMMRPLVVLWSQSDGVTMDRTQQSNTCTMGKGEASRSACERAERPSRTAVLIPMPSVDFTRIHQASTMLKSAGWLWEPIRKTACD